MFNLRIKAGLTVIILAGLMALLLPHQALAVDPPEEKININTASATELQKLPRIGEKVAQRIIDFRKKHGKFKKIEELMKVKGIGEKMFNNLKDLITIDTDTKAKKK